MLLVLYPSANRVGSKNASQARSRALRGISRRGLGGCSVGLMRFARFLVLKTLSNPLMEPASGR